MGKEPLGKGERLYTFLNLDLSSFSPGVYPACLSIIPRGSRKILKLGIFDIFEKLTFI